MNKEKIQKIIEALNSYRFNYRMDQIFNEELVKEALSIMQEEHNKPLPEPDAYQFQDSDGKWYWFKNEEHYKNPVKCGRWPIRALYAEPPASVQAEEYSDALRSLASYVGCGGYNANDPIDEKVFEEKIRYGIDLLLATQAQTTAMDSSLHYFAKQAEIINVDRLLSSLTIFGVATPDSKEESTAKIGNLVNALTRAILRLQDVRESIATARKPLTDDEIESTYGEIQ
jgi:hypothetical protein